VKDALRINMKFNLTKIFYLTRKARTDYAAFVEAGFRRKTMPKFRKKPVVIEAEQLTKFTILEIYTFIHGEPNRSSRSAEDAWDNYIDQVLKDGGIKLKTLESDGEVQKADLGDWIIKGVDEEFYPCKPHIFEKTYERVE